jgi:tRNA(fMet)-specific endonuclease VapC
MFLLDTNICIGLLKAQAPLVDRLRRLAPREVAVCSVVVAELFYGARKSQRVAENLATLRRFLAPLRSLPFDDRAAEDYGSVRAELERSGAPIGPADLMIASIARAHDCVLVSRDSRAFSRIVGLRWETW